MMTESRESEQQYIEIRGAREHNLKNVDLRIARGAITVITGVSGSGKSSLAFDTIVAEAQRRFFYTLSHYTRQFLDLGSRPAVGAISGLSPAIALAQNETQPSIRATVGTLTDISELLGVLFARFGERLCPTHQLPTSQVSIATILERLLADHPGQTLAVAAPVVEQKRGAFRRQLSQFAEKGYLRAIIDGELTSLSPLPELARDQKHDISILVDLVKVDAGRQQRLERSLQTALELGAGVGEYYLTDSRGRPKGPAGSKYSLADGCSVCGFSWPKMDSRYFSINSLGACQSCRGLGYLKLDDDKIGDDPWQWQSRECRVCEGSGLKRELESIRFFELTPFDAQLWSVSRLAAFLRQLQNEKQLPNPASQRILTEVNDHLQRIENVGLGYLSLSRRVRSLSGGEAQRLRLSGVIGEKLRGVLYVLDEPSQGLSPREIADLWSSLEGLKEAGNTLLIVDHDVDIIRRADWIIDLGPWGGRDGGEIMATFRPDEAPQFSDRSTTARYLAKDHSVLAHSLAGKRFRSWLTVNKPRMFNLKMDRARFPLGGMTVVTGVSGAGKSTLILSVLYQNLLNRLESSQCPLRYCEKLTGFEAISRVFLIDRKPIAKTSNSMPATYLDIFGEIRELFTKLPESQIAGLTKRSFSLSVDEGRCRECKGTGLLALSMKFLADAKIPCPACEGQRYQPVVLDVRYRDHSIADVLDLTIDEALDLFAHHRKILRRLQPAADLGLGYLKLGQPSSQLSGGESQRLKLVPLLSKDMSEESLMILDEPTRGLHFRDVELLLDRLCKLRQQGVTVILIEHNEDVLRAADWVLALGPGAADQGGEAVFEGYSSEYLTNQNKR
jgi:excinuclease ABC subunit A